MTNTNVNNKNETTTNENKTNEMFDLFKDGSFRMPPHDDLEHGRQKLSVSRRLVFSARRHSIGDVAENLKY